MVAKKINQCRICGSQNLKSVVNLGYQYIQGFFPKIGEAVSSGKGAEMSLVLCEREARQGMEPLVLGGAGKAGGGAGGAGGVEGSEYCGCGLLQTQYQLDPTELYTDYWYKSGTTATMTRHLRELVEEGIALLGQARGGGVQELELRVADIGCNDGTLLSYYPENFKRFGVDPSNVIPCNLIPTSDMPKSGITNAVAAPGASSAISKAENRSIEQPVFIQEFFPSKTLAAVVGNAGLDLITSIAMFYDLEEPNAFCREVKRLLAKSGLWLVEVSYMPRMVAEGWYDSICHEHVEYYSLTVLQDLFARNGLKIVKAALNDINGGSILCFVAHQECDAFDNCALSVVAGEREVAGLLAQEARAGLFNAQTFHDFQVAAEAHREELRALVAGLAEHGKRIHLYGASTKGNTLLQWCNLDHTLIECAAERSPSKIGLMTVGTGIPIVTEEQSRLANPDYYLVLPWHFRTEIIAREQAMLAQGTRFIFPFPEIEVVDARGVVGGGVDRRGVDGEARGGGVPLGE